MRSLFLLFLGLVVILISLSVYFYLDRDRISRKILLHTNRLTSGELEFEDITFNPFKHFPEISLTLVDVIYFEHHTASRNQNEEALADIGRLYAAIDIVELIRGDISVSKILLEDGHIRLVRYPDSTLNLLNSFKPLEEAEMPVAEMEDTTEFNLDIRQVSCYGIQVSFDDRVEGDKEALAVKNMKASFRYAPEEIRTELDTRMVLELVKLSDKVRFRDKSLRLESSITFQRLDRMLEIAPSRLTIDQAMMNIEGEIDFKVNDKFSLEVDGSDHDFSIFQLFLTGEGLENLEKGDLYFKGSITGIPGREIPTADFRFGLQDVLLYVPLADDYIREVKLSGSLNSGSKGDLSGLSLDLDTLQAVLPAGHVNASLHLQDLVSPDLDLILDMEASLVGLDQVLKLDFLDDLQGDIRTQCHLRGLRINRDIPHITADEYAYEISCRDVALSLPGILSLKKVDGRIHADGDTTWLEEFTVLTEDSDLHVNGTLFNVLHLPFRVEEEITMDLQVVSGVFDLPGFLSFVPEVGAYFPYRIKDAYLDATVETSPSRILEYEANPSMDFQVKQLDGTIEDFLPRTTNISGDFSMDEKQGRTFLDFREFSLDILAGSVEANLQLYTPAVGHTLLNMAAITRNLNVGKVFWYDLPDSIPDFLNGPLDASFRLDLHFPDDEQIIFKKLDLSHADLYLVNVTDTFEVSGLNILARDIYWDLDRHPNPLATLHADADESLEKLVTDQFMVENLSHDIRVRDGVFRVKTDQSLLLQAPGEGEYVLAPFAETPHYAVQFELNDLPVNKVMESFLLDTIITGAIDFQLDITAEGRDLPEIISGIKGELVLYGEDLTLHGIDLDEVIKQFRRSQNFNLVDVGAVMFAGPAGLALTKGGAYASMLVTDYGETSPISEIVSDWEFQDGTIRLRDVAFSTDETRIAAKGWLDFPRDSLDISFAVIDQRGCNIIGQDLYGSIKAPEKSKIKLFSTLLAPVTNLLEATLGIDCEPFYEGRVRHPGGE
jgi:AsmA protein